MIDPHRELALVVLSGGRGERLGGAVKPLLRVDQGRGPTILEVIEEAFRPHVARIVLVAPGEIARALCEVSSSAIVEDRGRGPGEALLDAARVVKEPWLFLVAADQPRPSVQLYSRIVAHAKQGMDAVVISDGSTRFPTFALYRREALLGITRIDGTHGIPLHGVLNVLEAETIALETLDENERAALLDADTPAAVRALGLAFDPEPNG
jgi:molybdopterin-guanine dinucleotide biosynthesis protein A